MATAEGLELCPYRMQECCRAGDDCLVGPVRMGDDPEDIADEARHCEFAGLELPPYFYRNLKVSERRRYSPGLAQRVLEGG